MKRFITVLVLVFSISVFAQETSSDEARGTLGFGGYGAISYSPATGRFGQSWNWATQWDAELAAQNFCAVWDCRVVVAVNNACAALAVNYYNTELFGWGWSYNSLTAANTAMNYCPGPCYIKTSFCSN